MFRELNCLPLVRAFARPVAAFAAGLAMTFTAGMTTATAQSRPLTVFAAASLKNVLDSAVKSFSASHDGVRIALSYAGTNTLARQIEQDAPADIFIAADQLWADYLRQRKLLRGPAIALAGNRLALIAPARPSSAVPADGRAALADIAALLKSNGRLALANTQSVPAGRYAKAALVKTGQWEALKGRLAEASNVRVALSYVARGEAPAGIVYATDALAEAAVRVIAFFPAASHDPIVYPAAAVASSKHPLAASFLAYLQSPAVQALFKKHGFTAIQNQQRNITGRATPAAGTTGRKPPL